MAEYRVIADAFCLFFRRINGGRFLDGNSQKFAFSKVLRDTGGGGGRGLCRFLGVSLGGGGKGGLDGGG